MIQVVCSPEECSVQITGHAGSGPKGQDLVCAAVSILVLTLEENVGKMAMHQMLEDYSVELSEGLACICCCPKPEYRMPVDMVLMSICTGFNLLAEKWPEYVSCRIVSGYAKHVGGTSHLQHCHADNRCEDLDSARDDSIVQNFWCSGKNEVR